MSGALRAVLLAAAAALVLPALAAGADAQEAAGMQCPAAALGEDCVYHVARTLDVGDILPSIVKVDPDTGKLYVASRPYAGSADAGHSYVRIYDSEDRGHRLIAEFRFNGTNSRVPDLEVNPSTGELHVVHLWGVGDRDHGWKGDGTDSKGKANLTTIDLDTTRVVGTVQLRHDEIPADGGSATTTDRYGIADLVLDRARDMAYIATAEGPILAVNTSDTTLLTTTVDHRASSGSWNAYMEGAPASALAVDEVDGWVYAAARVGIPSEGGSHSWGITKLKFTDGEDDLATAHYMSRYFFNGTQNSASGTDYNSYSDSANVRAESIHLYDHPRSLFVLYENHTVHRHPLNASGNPGPSVRLDIAGGPPVLLSTEHLRDAPADYPPGGNRIGGIALDDGRGLLYALVHDWDDPRVIVANAENGSVVGVASTAGQTEDLGLDPRTGSVYVLPSWAPHAYVIESKPKHDLQHMIDMANPGETVTVPAGIYDDVALNVNKSLTLTSETSRPGAAIFTGNSRITVASSDVTIRGLSFEGTDCLPGFGGSLVEIRAPHGVSIRGVAIENNAFRDTCHAAIQQKGSGSLEDVDIRYNSFEGIGLKIPLGRAEPSDTGGENGFQPMHGAIGLAYHHLQGHVSGTVEHNRINGTSAAGIRVFNAMNLSILNNHISNTPASAIGLAHTSSNVTVANNTIANANSEPDLDYLDGIDGSGVDGYYKIMDRYWQYLQMPFLLNDSMVPAPDAAINVWANGRGIEVTGNTISGSDGAFTACTGLCAFESAEPVRAAQQCRDEGTGPWRSWEMCRRDERAVVNRTDDRNILQPEDSDASTIRFSGNIIYADNTGGDNDGVLVRYDAGADKAELNAMGNFFVGFGSGPGAEPRVSGNVNISGRGQTAHGNASGPPGGVEYRVARTFAIDDIRADFIEVGPNGNTIYVGINPAIGAKSNDSAVHVYGPGYEKAGTYPIPGPVGRIVDMEVDSETGNLHVLHRRHDANQTTWQLGVTTLNGSASVVGMPWMVSRAMYSHHDAATADMAVGGGMVFVTNMRSNEPVAVLNGSTLRPLDLSGDERAAAVEAAGRIAGIAVDARDGHTLAYLATQKDDGTTRITIVNFSSAEGRMFQSYTRVGEVQASSGSVGVRDMIVDSENGKLFVLWDYQRLPGERLEINQTISMYDISDSSLEAGKTLKEARPVDGFVMHGHGASSIALDRGRDVLHAVVHDSTDPRMVSYNSSSGNVTLTTSLSDQPAAVAVAGGGGGSGTVYASPSWRPNVYVIERAPAHPLQGMIYSAPAGGVVEVPPGTYADAVLTIDKPLVLTSPTGRAGPVELTGLSRIHVEADGVTIRGLSFRDTACLPGMAASLVEIGMRPGNHSTDKSMRSDVTVENSAFANTCHAAIQQEGWGRMDNIVIRDNRFEDIGLRLEGGRTEPIDTDGEDEFIHTHGAIGLAYHPGQDPVSNSVITGNTILGTSAAGIRVFNADNVTITNNYIRDTPASGIGLSHGSEDSHVSGNTIIRANSEPDFDYLDGISGSGEDGYYRLITRHYDYALEIRLTEPIRPLAPDAAVKVWANSANVSVTGNTIIGSGGAFTACAGTCASESDGLVHPGERNVLDPARYNVGGPANRIAFNWNVVAGDNDLNNSSLLANDASGELDATWNHYPGHSVEGAQLRSGSTVDISENATRVVGVAAPSPPGKALETGDSVSIAVTLSRNVTVGMDSGKRPTLVLNSGGTAVYVGPLQDKIMFVYTVRAGEGADRLDYASHDALRLNGATIDGMPGPLALTLPPPGEPGSLGASSDLSVNRKLQAVIGDLGDRGSATIPAGEYRDAVITISAPRNLTAEPGAVLTGNSRVIVEAGADRPVVLTGLAFRGTACYEDGGATLVVRAPADGTAAPVVIRNGTFDGTCSAAIEVLPAAAAAGGGPESSPDPARPGGQGQQGGAPPRSSDAPDAGAAPASRILITGNTFRGVGAGAPDAAGSTAAIRLGLQGAAGAVAGAVHVKDSIVSSNYVFDSQGPAVEAAAARGVDIVGNHIEGAGSAAVRVMKGSSNVSVAGNTIINASGAALEVWADSSGVVIMGNRISESRGALLVCSGECALDGGAARMRVESAPQASQAIRFHYNILHESNRGGMLVKNDAPDGLLNASYNYYPGYTPMQANFTNASSYAPPMPAGTAPHRVGSLLALTDMPYLDGVGSAAAMREAVERFGLERVESGRPASIELVQADLRLADPLAAVRGMADGIDDDRNYPILHNQILWMRGMLDADGRGASISAVRALESPQEHYPFILDREGRVLANGAIPDRFGVISPIASAPNPVPFADVVRALEAESNSTAWRNYPIPNFVREGTPIESKRSLLALYDFGDTNKTNDLILGAGYYLHPVKLAVGPSDGPSIRLAKGLAAERGLALASHGSTGADLALPDTVYRMIPNELRSAQRLADVMADDDGIRRVVALVQDDADGNRAYGLIKKEFEERSGGTVLPGTRFSASIAPAEWADVMNRANRDIVAALAGPGGNSTVAVLYIGSDSNYIDAAAEAAGRLAMHSVRWYSTDLAGSRAVVENRTALDMALRTNLTAVAFGVAPNEHTAAVDAAIAAHPHAAAAAEAAAVAAPPNRAYAAYDAVRLLGSALAKGGANATSFAAMLHGLAAEHSGTLGRGIAFDANGDLVRPSNFSTWKVSPETRAWASQLPVGPPPVLVCSAELARGTLPLGDVQVGAESAPQAQTVMNTGSLPLVGVQMNAEAWSNGLPAGVTSFRAGGGTGAFAPITPNASVLAQGENVMPGLGLVVEHRVDLRSVKTATEGPMTQAVTYTVSCR